MAIHVTCSSGRVFLPDVDDETVPIETADLDWSETLAAPGTTTATVAAVTYPSYAQRILTITAYGAPAWVAVGTTPNAGTNPRRYVPDGASIQVGAKVGYKVAWATVT